MSAELVILFKSWVPVWQTVTVALAPAIFWRNKAAAGFPTMLLLPQITICLPAGSLLVLISICWTPAGVPGMNIGCPSNSLPMLTG